jgi:hypothetical protein
MSLCSTRSSGHSRRTFLTPEDTSLKLLHLNRQIFAAELKKIERAFDVAIAPPELLTPDRDGSFYPQFPQSVRDSARAMAQHYEIFYCLENWIRDLVQTKLTNVAGEDWWEQCVPEAVRDNADRNLLKEKDAAMSARSSDPIDYTNFGELSNIIEFNWETFSDTFNSKKGLVAVLSRLNLLRAPIAHCSELSQDEVVRLKLSLADFFRLME